MEVSNMVFKIPTAKAPKIPKMKLAMPGDKTPKGLSPVPPDKYQAQLSRDLIRKDAMSAIKEDVPSSDPGYKNGGMVKAKGPKKGHLYQSKYDPKEK